MRDRTRAFLRRRLDAYEGRAEKKSERFWDQVNRGMEALDNRPTLKHFFYILLVLEALYWIAVLLLPSPVMQMVGFLADWSNKGLAAVFGVVFGTGLYIAYVLFRFRYPHLEDCEPGREPVASAYLQQAAIERKFRVWLASVVAGVFNVLALVLVMLLRLYGWR